MNGTDIASGILGGAITGAALGAAMPLGGAAGALGLGARFGIMLGTTFGAGMASYAVETKGNNREFNVKDMLIRGRITAVQGTMAFGMSYVTSSLFKMAGMDRGFALTRRFISTATGDQLNFCFDIAIQSLMGNKLSMQEALKKYIMMWAQL
jgi:hypothetical protein